MYRHFTEFPFALRRYAVLCIALGSALIFSPFLSAHADDRDAEQKPHLFVWTGGSTFYQKVEINGAPLDHESYFNETELEELPDDGYFLFLTKGNGLVPDAELREQFQIQDDQLESVVAQGHSVRTVRNFKKVVLGTDPVRTFTQHIILLDLNHMDALYRQDCIREIIFLNVVGRPTKSLISECKLKQP
jgi:hypothetical protein